MIEYLCCNLPSRAGRIPASQPARGAGTPPHSYIVLPLISGFPVGGGLRGCPSRRGAGTPHFSLPFVFGKQMEKCWERPCSPAGARGRNPRETLLQTEHRRNTDGAQTERRRSTDGTQTEHRRNADGTQTEHKRNTNGRGGRRGRGHFHSSLIYRFTTHFCPPRPSGGAPFRGAMKRERTYVRRPSVVRTCGGCRVQSTEYRVQSTPSSWIAYCILMEVVGLSIGIV
jgi:hypothetical protein